MIDRTFGENIHYTGLDSGTGKMGGKSGPHGRGGSDNAAEVSVMDAAARGVTGGNPREWRSE